MAEDPRASQYFPNTQGFLILRNWELRLRFQEYSWYIIETLASSALGMLCYMSFHAGNFPMTVTMRATMLVTQSSNSRCSSRYYEEGASTELCTNSVVKLVVAVVLMSKVAARWFVV